MRDIGLSIVVGLAAEARIARALGAVAIGGGQPEGAGAAAQRLIASGADCLLSFGLAGGLDPGLRPGSVLIPHTIVYHQRAYPVDTSLIGTPTPHILIATDTAIKSAREKYALYVETGAHAVDLESGEVALAAAAANIPMAALRVVCDPSDRDLGSAALVGIGATGHIAVFRVLAELSRDIGQIWGLFGLAKDARAAHASLREATRGVRCGRDRGRL